MAWTGGYPEAGHSEHVTIATGIELLEDDAIPQLYAASADVTSWTFTGTAPADGAPAVTWSTTTRIRIRRTWDRSGSNYLPRQKFELVVDVHVVPVDVEATVTSVTATNLRWSVWRVV